MGEICSVKWLTDCVSWPLVQHIKNFSLLLQLLAWPSSSRCLIEERGTNESQVLFCTLRFYVFYELLMNKNEMRFFMPECIGRQIALTPTSGFEFDKRPARRVKGAHEGDANAEYHKPVASNNPCKISEDFCETNRYSIPLNVFFFLPSRSPNARFLAVTSEHGW